MLILLAIGTTLVGTLPKTNVRFAPENRPKRPKRKRESIPTIHFQGLKMLVSGSVVDFILMMWGFFVFFMAGLQNQQFFNPILIYWLPADHQQVCVPMIASIWLEDWFLHEYHKKSIKCSWAVLSGEQMSKGWPFSLLNDEQMSNWLGVEHQPGR